MSKNSSDIVLTESENRYTMFPINDQTVWKMYKKQMECFWRCEEVDLIMRHFRIQLDPFPFYLRLFLILLIGCCVFVQ